MRTLILKFGAIGDVIMLLPAAHALHLSGHEIDWACSPTVLPLLSLYPWINLILVDECALVKGSVPQKARALLDLWRAIAGRRYDQVATLYYDRRYRLAALPVRAPRKILLSHSNRSLRLLPGRHHTDEYARILLNLPDEAHPTQLPPVPPPRLPASPLPRTPGRTRIVLAPAGARNLLRDDLLRRWPPEFYAELTRLLLTRQQEQEIEIVLMGGPDDTWVRTHFSGLPVTDLIGALSLPQSLALLEDADVLVTHDTGPLHLAGLTRIGIVSLFGPTDPHGRLPQRPGALALWGGEHFACRPCYDGRDFAPCPSNDCIRQITPTHVFLQIVQSLRNQSLPLPPQILPILDPYTLSSCPPKPSSSTATASSTTKSATSTSQPASVG